MVPSFSISRTIPILYNGDQCVTISERKPHLCHYRHHTIICHHNLCGFIPTKTPCIPLHWSNTITYRDIDLQYVIGSKEGIERKPSPQAVENILYNMGINIEEALYIGDSGVDIKTARNAKVDILCVGWGFKSKEELLKEGNIKIVETPSEILKYIKEKNNA